ncbi:hypothetical protein A2U01_0091096, partial [Trifolium medium]|nr:hypothetical protein [Trifolium medium]
MILDASAGGSLKSRDETQARELIEIMAHNEYRAQNDRGDKKKGGVRWSLIRKMLCLLK